jgi:hypothetical protein
MENAANWEIHRYRNSSYFKLRMSNWLHKDAQRITTGAITWRNKESIFNGYALARETNLSTNLQLSWGIGGFNLK